MRYAAHGNFTNCEEVIAAAQAGEQSATCALKALARYLAIGCASIVNLLDPEMLILAGGLAQDNALLVRFLTEELSKRVTVWPERHLQVQASSLGYSAGVLGAAAVASLASCSANGGASPAFGKDAVIASAPLIKKTSG